MDGTGPGHPGTGNTQGPRDTVEVPCEEFGCAGPRSAAGAAALRGLGGAAHSGDHAACAGPRPVFADADALESDLLRI